MRVVWRLIPNYLSTCIQVMKYPRKDAFEVYVMLKEEERTFAREVVFSRHRCHRWPEDEVVLERIQAHVAQKMELHHAELAEKQQAKRAEKMIAAHHAEVDAEKG